MNHPPPPPPLHHLPLPIRVHLDLDYLQVNRINLNYLYLHPKIQVKTRILKQNVVPFVVSHHHQPILHQKQEITKNLFIHVEESIKLINE